ncbi:MAG: cell division ATP-binding protein FtsE [Thalassolituus sp.]|jgi:cell division transport system ATP-binding protein|uniref:cell division ATP-binding protein FtsE n=1 Tax=Thalassolituus sp. TaxID=2030822 RepID=UPI0026232844|nr:cell division ATP-binding protein FtsE [uncultured Thalassolituus sp.]TNC92649.1 MAG: cell division ATP-binding protein FtsE [Thalassolituus sp.]
MSMVRFEGVGKRYAGGKDALSNISFELAKGEFAFLTGHSGAGKSTLLKLMTLMERPSRGTVYVDGQDLGRMRSSQVPYLRRRIGTVFQNHQLLFDRTVFDNVALPLLVSGFQPAETARRVRAALDSVGLLGYEGRNPIELSGGEQQRVGIARAVVNKPKLLLADEPTGNLDPELSEEIMNLFLRFQQVGVTVLIATHDISLIERMGHRRLILDHGSLYERVEYGL